MLSEKIFMLTIELERKMQNKAERHEQFYFDFALYIYSGAK